MKSLSRLLIAVMALSVLSGCIVPERSGTDPLMGTAAGIAGVVDAKHTREKQKQKKQQQSVNDYLDTNRQ